VTSIGVQAFQGCTNLAGITIPAWVTSIQDETFQGCTKLAGIVIPGRVATIGFEAFSGCTALASVTLPAGLTTIDEQAFQYCSALVSITIPAAVTSLGIESFANCGLTTISFQGNAPSADSTTFQGDTRASITYQSGTTGWSDPFDGVPATVNNVPPATITTQPGGATVSPGASATFSAAASGTGPFSTLWYFNGTAIAGSTGTSSTPSYTVSNVQAANSGAYTVTVSNPGGSVTSQSAFLTVTAPAGTAPTVGSQPQSFTTSPGSTTVLTVNPATGQVTSSSVASGLSPRTSSSYTYQWYYNGTALVDGPDITGSLTATLVLTGSASKAGSYVCLVANTAGSVLSQPAQLTVNLTSDLGRLVNISCRAQVGTGSNILIPGFVIGGSDTSGSLSALVRGSGPALSLPPFNVPGTLPDPELLLYADSTMINSDNGWGGNAQIASVAAAVGAQPWSNPSSKDSAIISSLASGAYTAPLLGAGGDTGVALAEVYDATPAGTYAPSNSRIINLSARAVVGSGSNILIAGFVIGGSTARTVLIRASGPALAVLGVPGTLPDPQLQVYSSSLLASDNGWAGSAQISNIAATVGAQPWTDPTSKDSAIVITLPPGAYTALVSGASGDTGIALVEVYEVP
jgi:hypothetical protein